MISWFRNHDGFTLVELLVSMALLSLMSMYFLAAATFLKDIQRVEGELEAQMEVDALVRHMRDTISDARFSYIAVRDASKNLSFTGTSDRLDFVGMFDGYGEIGGVYRLIYRLDEEGNLVIDRGLAGNDRKFPVDTLVLLRGVAKIKFKYISPTPSSFEEYDQWTRSDALPRMVGVEVEFPRDDKRRWPIAKIPIAAAR